jgi:DedD protein
MDEQVKARLIGATVLVVIAVLLVPELLSGPRRDAAEPAAAEGRRGTRTVTIDLGGAAASGARLQTPGPAEPAPRATSPSPTVAAPGSNATRDETDVVEAEAPPAVKPSATVAASEPIPPPPAQTTSSTVKPEPATAKPTVTATKPATTAAGGWAVQVGAFSSAQTARKLVTDLKKDGLPAYVAPLDRNGKTLHRVRVGPAPTRADADKLAARLKARGLPASVVSGA